MTDESEEAGAVLDGFLVLGTEAGVKAVIDTKEGGETLSDAEGYQNALEDAAEDRLGLFFVNSPALQASLQRGGARCRSPWRGCSRSRSSRRSTPTPTA